MLNVVIAILILAVFILQLVQVNTLKDKVKKEVYQWWHIPWETLLYSVMMYILYQRIHFPELPMINSLEDFQAEAVYVLLCVAIWFGMHWFLRASTIHNSLIETYRKLFASKRPDKDKALPFPYFFSEDDVVKARVGQVFYRWTLKILILLVAVVYAAFFILYQYAHIDFYLVSSFGLLGLLPIVEYYVYLCAEVPMEKEVETAGNPTESDFDRLWQVYVDTFDNYSVAWKRANDEDDNRKIERWRLNNEEGFSRLMKEFTDAKADVFVENCDLATAFIKMEPFIDLVEKNGRHVLIALEIPRHFSRLKEKTYTEEIADELEEILKKNFNVYDEKSTKESLHESVIIAPLSLISRQGLNYEWMSKIGLIVVVNIFDKGVSNLFENRRFCYILRSVNENYQLLFVTPHRRGTEPSMKNTWITGEHTREEIMSQFAQGEKQFFIGYNYEEYADRFGKVLIKSPNEPLYSGTEMSLIALSFKHEDEEKAVTPVHYLDLAYTHAIEGPEELGKLNKLNLIDDKLFEVTEAAIHENIKSHLLPVEQIVEDKVFSVVFDQENNAPVAYRKWRHLGLSENFSVVISKPYLFRDFFNANHGFFSAAPFEALAPQLCKSRITLAIILLNLLKDAEGGMEEKELRNLLIGYYSENELRSVPMIIKTLLSKYFSSDLANMLKTTDVVGFNGSDYQHHTMYELGLTDSVDLTYLDMVTIIDESGNVLFDILNDLMYQNYCKGQLHSFSGNPYIISDYDKKTKTLKVKSRNINDQEFLFYKPSLDVTISGKPTPIKDMAQTMECWNHRITGQEISFCSRGFETEVSIVTDEMYKFTTYRIGGLHSSDNCPPTRTYNNGKVLMVSFNYINKPEYIKRADDIRKSLQILLYEAFQSVFPHHAQYLIVASEGEGDEDLPWIFNRFQNNLESQTENDPVPALTYYFIEDAHIDLGLIGALSDRSNIWYIFRYIYDYLIWLSEGDPVVPEGYDAYLNRKDFDKFSFLKYGRTKLPSYFDVELLINFIRDFFEKGDEWQTFVSERQIKQDAIGVCDFCRKEMKNSEMTRLGDGRMRCPDCSVDAIDTERQFRPLCDKAKELFKNYLGIDFDTIRHTAKLVSAVELHKLYGVEFSITNGYDVRKLLGLARDRKYDSFYVENGRKPDDTLRIIVHEMTHIWEYQDEGFAKVRANNEDWVEGLAVWTELFLMEKNGMDVEKERQKWLDRDDEYGRGLKHIMKLCPNNPYKYIKSVNKI